MKQASGRIRAGIGGWNYAPWRETFYPEGLPHARELEYASRQVTAIEINATFYRTQKATSFAKWRDESPDDFVFAVKAPRYTTIRRVLPDAAPLMAGFIGSGLAELGDKLGPILWQLAPTKRYDAEEVEAFLKLLPREIGGRPVRNALEPRHASFADPGFVELARRYGCAVVFTDSDEYPSMADVTTDFVYARLVRARPAIKTGYPAREIARWAAAALTFAEGGDPEGLPRLAKRAAPCVPRDVFVFFIDGAKERAPAAACAFLKRLRSTTS